MIVRVLVLFLVAQTSNAFTAPSALQRTRRVVRVEAAKPKSGALPIGCAQGKSLAEFQDFASGGSIALGVLVDKKGKSWRIVGADGTIVSVSSSNINYVDSSTKGWTQILDPAPALEECERVAAATLGDAPELARVAWETLLAVEKTAPIRSLPQLAELIFGSPTPCPESREDDEGEAASASLTAAEKWANVAARYATYRLLRSSAGRAYFRAVASSAGAAPVYRANTAAEVKEALGGLTKADAQRERWKSLAQELKDVVEERRRRRQSRKVESNGNSPDGFSSGDGKSASSDQTKATDEAAMGSALQDLEELAVLFDPSGTSERYQPGKGPGNNSGGAKDKAPNFAAAMLGRDALKAWPATAEGAFRLLVDLGHWSQHRNLDLDRSGLGRGFPDEVLGDASRMLASASAWPLDPLAGARVDLRGKMQVYAVDSKDTFEVDDGVAAERLDGEAGGQGRIRVWVHVSDASRWVPDPYSPLAKQAFTRPQTLYLPCPAPLPMLPGPLVAWVMSLAPPRIVDETTGPRADPAFGAVSPDSSRGVPALSVCAELAASGALIPDSVKLAATLIDPPLRLDYAEVDEMLEHGLCGPREPDWALGELETVARRRLAWRRQHGCVVAQTPSVRVKAPHGESDPSGPVECEPVHGPEHGHGGHGGGGAFVSPRSEVLVTELMVLAGECVGLLGRTHGLALPYRANPAPPAAEYPSKEELAALDEAFRNEPLCRSAYLRKFMRRTDIKPSPGKHWSMGVEHYVQWTSPLRRQLDLATHWQLKGWLLDEWTKSSGENQSGGDRTPKGGAGLLFGGGGSEGPMEPGANNGKPPRGFFTRLDKAGLAQVLAARSGPARRANAVQRGATQYWIHEHLRRRVASAASTEGSSSSSGAGGNNFEALVLGPAPPSYASDYRVLLLDLGLELAFQGPVGLSPGARIHLAVGACNPRRRTLTLVQVPPSGST
mmetsp:Transcript_25450/g.57140  ORF Transcript_25450/g.57140 Transcript_25450/m.57140 type:complete len:953 (+) Transcript_25450:221-3079(+)